MKSAAREKIKNLVIAGLLIAVSVVIPIFMPVKIVLIPFTFTLASHVPIYLAAFISPAIAAVVAIGSAVGFLLSGLPAVVAARAFTHIVFAVLAAILIRKGWALKGPAHVILFLLLTGVIHGLLEVLVIIPFGFGGDQLWFAALVLGGGSVLHNAVDFFLAYLIYKALSGARLMKKIR